MIDREIGNGYFLPDVSTHLSHAADRRSFAIALMEIEHQQQVGNQPRQELEEHPVRISGQEMIHVQMPFPPGEKGFDFPSQGENEADLLGRQIGSIGGYPVNFAT